MVSQGEQFLTCCAPFLHKYLSSQTVSMSTSYHHSGMHPGGLDGSQLIPGLATSMDPLEALLGPFPCVRVRGLPFDATSEDVLVFFQGLAVIDVVLASHEESGEAFVVFTNLADFQMGLSRDHGNRYLEIFQGKRSDYYAAIASQHHQWHGAGGLPENNVLAEGQSGGKALASPIPGIEGSLEITGETTQSFSVDGGGWKKSCTPSSVPNVSIKGRQGTNNGVSTYRIRSGNYGGRGGNYGGRCYRGNSRGGGSHHGGGVRDGPHTGFIRMRGLPYQATKQDVLDFFKDYKPIESSVLLTYRPDGRSSGEGYVAFDDASDAKAAMTMHRSTIGSRYIELFISNKEEHSRNVARSTPR
mmetsp:Transcript_21238/g.36513  ORF Transcript_21238/g.36513 Transcript_21238/m.36513 type:complete len:357 (+) Transcript_21238:294-1364(+)